MVSAPHRRGRVGDGVVVTEQFGRSGEDGGWGGNSSEPSPSPGPRFGESSPPVPPPQRDGSPPGPRFGGSRRPERGGRDEAYELPPPVPPPQVGGSPPGPP